MKKQFLFFTSLSWLFAVKVFAIEPRIFMIEKNGKEERQIALGWPLEHKTVFQGPNGDNTSQARVMYYVYNIVPPAELGVVQAEGKDAIVKFEGNSMLISSYSVRQYLELVTRKNEKKTIMIENLFTAPPPIEVDNCRPNHPTLNFENKNPPPFAVGYACINRPNQARAVTITLPSEATITSSSFFDLLGKGERWRMYELPDASSGGALGTIEISFYRKNYKLFIVAKDINVEVQQRRLEELEEENARLKQELSVSTGLTSAYQKVLSIFNLSLGLGSSSMQATFPEAFGDAKYADSELAVFAQAKTKPFFYNLYGRLDFTGTIPMNAKTTRQDMYEGRMFWGYKFEPVKDLAIVPLVVMMMTDYSENSRAFRVQSGHFGFGLDLDYKRGNNNFALEYSNASAGSIVIKEHNAFGLSYSYKLGTSKIWWTGFKFQSQKFSGITSAGEKRSIAENKAILFVGI
jgi:hypothetical protein